MSPDTIANSARAAPALPPAAQAFVAGIDAHDPTVQRALQRAYAITHIVAGLSEDEDIRRGAMLLPLLEAGLIEEAKAAVSFGVAAQRLAGELVRLGSLGMPARPDASLSSTQAEAL